jgi:signal transduction histidine kinase
LGVIAASPEITAAEEHRLAQVAEVGQRLVNGLDPDEILTQAVAAACDITEARYAAVGIPDTERLGLARFAELRLADETDGAPASGPTHDLVVKIHGEAYGNFYLSDKRCGGFTEADEQALSELGEWVAIALKGSVVNNRLEDQRDSLDRAVKTFEAMAELAREVAGQTSLDRLLTLTVKRAQPLIGARTLVVLLRESGDMVAAASAGEMSSGLPDLCKRLADRVPISLLEPGAATRVPVATEDARSDDGGIHPRNAALVVPLLSSGHSLGRLVALDPVGGGEFTAENERVLVAFAASAGAAIATAQCAATESIASVQGEGDRWARDLHDETLQQLANVRITLDSARVAPGADQTGELLNQGITGVNEVIAVVRQLIHGGAPGNLDHLHLADSLRTLVESSHPISELDVDLTLDLDFDQGKAATRLTPATEEPVYRFVQEALNNVVKHSGTAHAEVEVVEAEGDIFVRVSDDGRGFDLASHHAGRGLDGMTKRMQLAGGIVSLESKPGKGTTIEARLPAPHLKAAPAAVAVAPV